MFKKIKNKIKLAKIIGLIIAILFITMLANNIYLNCKIIKLEQKIEKAGL